MQELALIILKILFQDDNFPMDLSNLMESKFNFNKILFDLFVFCLKLLLIDFLKDL